MAILSLVFQQKIKNNIDIKKYLLHLYFSNK